MYEYKCKMVRVVDGDTVDVDIDLGLAFGYKSNQFVCMVLIHQNHEHLTK